MDSHRTCKLVSLGLLFPVFFVSGCRKSPHQGEGNQPKQEEHAAKHKNAKVEYFAEQRAVNAKNYLVNEKGIDPARIAIATGTADDQNVEDYLVPAGASFSADVQGTSWIKRNRIHTRGA